MFFFTLLEIGLGEGLVGRSNICLYLIRYTEFLKEPSLETKSERGGSILFMKGGLRKSPFRDMIVDLEATAASR